MNISDAASSSVLQSLFAPASSPASPTSSTPSSSTSPSGSTSPAVQAASLLASSESALFSSIGGGSSGLPDLSGLTAAAQAYSLYTNPAMLQQLATGGATTPSTAATPSTPSAGAVNTSPAYSFNPFDQASWWSDPSSSLGTTVDATA